MTNDGDLSAITAEPFSTALSQFQDLFSGCDGMTVLMGAGCSRCAGLPLIKELTDKVLDDAKVDCLSKEILTSVKDIFAEAPDSHIEDYLSEIVDLLAITDRRAERGVNKNTIAVGDHEYTGEQLRKATNQIKRAIAGTIRGKVDISIHRDFVASLHRPIRVGRRGPSQPVDYLVLNYDTIVEDALAMVSVPYADGLRGGATAWWDLDTFSANGIAARVIKLHGSIDWYQMADDTTPRRFGNSIDLQEQEDAPMLIWPSSTKYKEAQLDPFAQLLELARSSMRASRGTQRLLVICGYSFGDNHINLEIEKAIRDSDGNLTVTAFTNRDHPADQLKKWREDRSVKDQVLVFANRGFFHGDNGAIAEKDLPWWKFENLTRILNGEI